MKKNFARIILALIVFTLVFALVACGEDKNGGPSSEVPKEDVTDGNRNDGKDEEIGNTDDKKDENKENGKEDEGKNEPTLENHTHQYSDSWQVVKEATCVKAGEERRYCKAFDGCEEYESRTVDPTGIHDYDEGYGWVYAEATCTKGEERRQNCLNEGCEAYKSTFGEPIDHTWIYGEYVEGCEPTCTEGGKLFKKCEVCLTESSDDVDPFGHSDWTVYGYDATCTETGLTDGRKCYRCGEWSEAQREIPATGHLHKTADAAVAATCTAPGLTAGEHCEDCGAITVIQTIIPTLGHRLRKVDGPQSACEASGYTDWYYCDREGCDIESEVVAGIGTNKISVIVPHTAIPYLGHRFVDGECALCHTPENAENSLQYSVNTDGTTCTVIGVADGFELTDLVISDKYGDYTVTAIKADAFKNRTTIETVSIPSSVKTIGAGAFSGCGNISRMTIPFVGAAASLKVRDYQYPFGYIFGSNSYDGATAVRQRYNYAGYAGSGYDTSETYYIPTKLTEVTVLGGTVITNGEDGDANEKILFGAFSSCSTLKYIAIEGAVDEIRNYAVYNCENLIGVTYPDTVKKIGESAFNGCKNLAAIPLNEGLTEVGRSAFYGCSSVTGIRIPSTLATIGYSSFQNTGLLSLDIPNTVTEIGDYAFCGTKIKGVTIPGSVKVVGNSAFYGCPDLEIAMFKEGVEKIGGTVFMSSQKLHTVYIPRTVTEIGGLAFYVNNSSGSSASVARVYIQDLSSWLNIDFSGSRANPLSLGGHLYVINDDLTSAEEVTSLSASDFEGVTEIKPYAFGGGRITSVELSDTVTKIGESAFRGCPLKSVVIGSAVEEIGTGAFSYRNIVGSYYNYGNLKEITFKGNALKTIGCEAFEGAAITSLVVPDGVETIENSAFKGCGGINSVSLPDSVTYIGSYAFNDAAMFSSSEYSDRWEDGVLYFGKHLISVSKSSYGGPAPTEYRIKEGTLTIAGQAFNNCSSLTSIYIPDSVTYIGDYAFNACENLVTVEGMQGVKKIGWHAFDECGKLESVNLASDSLTEIQDYAFFWCSSLEEVEFGSSLEIIGDGAFCSCTGLNDIKNGFPESLRYIGNSAFWACYGITELVIPDGVEYIGQGAFGGLKNLESITVSYDSIKERVTIDDEEVLRPVGFGYIFGEFSDNGFASFVQDGRNYTVSYTLKHVTVTSGALFNYAFRNFPNLETITLNAGVTNIVDSAFIGCPAQRIDLNEEE